MSPPCELAVIALEAVVTAMLSRVPRRALTLAQIATHESVRSLVSGVMAAEADEDTRLGRSSGLHGAAPPTLAMTFLRTIDGMRSVERTGSELRLL